MRYLKIALLLLAVTFGTQACILPVPVGGGWASPPRLALSGGIAGGSWPEGVAPPSSGRPFGLYFI